MRICYLKLVGIAAVLLLVVAGCSLGGDDESEADGELPTQAQTTNESSPETKPESTAPAETTGSVTDRASAEVGEDGFHLEVGRYKFDAPSGVAPEGTKIEVTTFQEEPYEVTAQGGNSERAGVDFRRLSSKTTVESRGAEVAQSGGTSGITLRNTGRGFTVDTPDGVQLEKPLHVTFPSNEYGGSLQNVGANEPAPALLREQGNGLVWGGAVSYDEDKDIVGATLNEVGKFSIGAIQFANEAGGFMGEVADQMFTGGTPRPDCHEQPVETSDGGTISVDAPPKTVWTCLQQEGENVTVTLTNDYPSPLIVGHESPNRLRYPEGLSPGDEYAVEYIREFQGKEVLPAKGTATLTYPVDSLPASIELSTDLEVARAMLYGRGLESQATSFGGPLLSTYSDAQGGMDCFDNVLREEYAAGTACATTFAGKKTKTVGAIIRVGKKVGTLTGQLMDEITGPSIVTINYEPPPEQNQTDRGFERFVGDWRVHGTQMTIRSDSTGETTSNVGPCITSLDYEGPMCNEIHQLEFSEATSGGIVASITSIDYETWEGNSPPSGFEPSGIYQVGDSFKLEFVDDNLLRTTYLGRAADLNGQGNPYWCNAQTSEANVPKCGA